MIIDRISMTLIEEIPKTTVFIQKHKRNYRPLMQEVDTTAWSFDRCYQLCDSEIVLLGSKIQRGTKLRHKDNKAFLNHVSLNNIPHMLSFRVPYMHL